MCSAFYNSPVSVEIVYNTARKNGDDEQARVYDRQVTLHCMGSCFCTATSTISLSSDDVIRLVEVEGIGIGQLFRHMRLLPTFFLLSAGRKDGMCDVFCCTKVGCGR